MLKEDYLTKHFNLLKENASECALFLNKDNMFPLDLGSFKKNNPNASYRIALIGCGVRHLVKGGSGSGYVYSPNFINCEEAFSKAGFEIVSTDWLDKYDQFKEKTKKSFIKETIKTAKKYHIAPYMYSMGYFDCERDYDISCDYECDACIYVLSRNSGEGNDRRDIKGDIRLSDKELSDILYLNKKHQRFILVLNIGGVIDLSLLKDVKNILLISQLGVVTSEVLVDIITGKQNPSGKLATTFTYIKDYPSYNYFGDINNTYYKEDIYVGYRYFNTIKKEVLYPFGFGLSYTDFRTSNYFVSAKQSIIKVDYKCKNIGKYSGKEVVQLYLSKPNTTIKKAAIELCGFKKTIEMLPNEEISDEISFDLLDFSAYDEINHYYILEKGDYFLSIGNSSQNIKKIAKLRLDVDFIVKMVDNKLGTYKDVLTIVNNNEESDELNLQVVKIDLSSIKTIKIEYQKDCYVDEEIKKLDNHKLALICLGNHHNGLAGVIGGSATSVVGGAGETTLNVKEITNSLTMADGPQGIRITPEYIKNSKGNFATKIDSFMEKMIDYLPKISRPFIYPKKRKGEYCTQYTTAIPIATAISQSFNPKFAYLCGQIVSEEMKMYNVDLWLAPAMNIQRDIRCGRNFEYYSEDPYLSAIIAIAITKAVEEKGLGVTIKHFACNNQELNRTNNNSIISERALREIYLKGFELVVKYANPKAIMTSYNLINNVHTSESYQLINDILRCEWNYQGLVMTDWVKSGRSWCKKSKYPSCYADNHILAGNDLTMPGCTKDYKYIINGLKSNKISRDDLIFSASRIYRVIKQIKK